MASIPMGSSDPRHMYCARVGTSARVIMSRALQAEVGLDLRSSGAALLASDGAIDVQVPSATGLQTYAGSGVILRVRPRNPEWIAWRELGPGVRYRDYELGLAQHLTPAQVAAGRGGPTEGAKQICLRFALRLGQERCSHTILGRADGGVLAQVIVFRDIRPAEDTVRAWTHRHPNGIYLHNTRLPDRSSPVETPDSDNPSHGCKDGFHETAVHAVVRAARAQGTRGGVASVGISDDVLPTSALKRRRADTSTLAGPQARAGGEEDATQPDVRTPPGSPPRQAQGLAGIVVLILLRLLLV
jgi:hypothetical protein